MYIYLKIVRGKIARKLLTGHFRRGVFFDIFADDSFFDGFLSFSRYHVVNIIKHIRVQLHNTIATSAHARRPQTSFGLDSFPRTLILTTPAIIEL